MPLKILAALLLSATTLMSVAQTGYTQIGNTRSYANGVTATQIGTYVTNFHVVEGAKNICIRTSDGKLEKAVVASSNQEDDLVLLRSAVQRPPLQFAPPYDVAKGMTVLTIGYGKA